jgi:hypothetical protein
MLGDDRELDLAGLDVVDGVGRISLLIDNLLWLECCAGPARSNRCKERPVNEWR